MSSRPPSGRSVLARRLLELLGAADPPAAETWRARQSQDRELTSEEVEELAAEVASATHDSALGLTLGSTSTRGAFGLLEFVTRSAPTLREALRVVVELQEMLAPKGRIALREQDDWLVVEDVGSPALRFRNEFRVALMVATGRQLTGDMFRLERAWFTHARPPAEALARWRDFGACDELVFGAPTTGVMVRAAVLDLPLVSADVPLHEVLLPQARAVLAQLPRADPFVLTVRERVAAGLEARSASVEQVAAGLAVTVRTLQRRLEAQGHTFKALTEEVRRALAMLYLANPTFTVSEVSYKLGYADPRAFVRAFKRWEGLPPATYRAQKRAGFFGSRSA